MYRRLAPLALALLPAALAAQEPLTGYSAAAAARQRTAEAAAVRVPSPDRARTLSRALGAETHVAGTPAQERTRDYVIAQMRAMGMQTEVRTYRVYMPHATSVHVWRVSPDMRELELGEPAVPGDSTSGLAQYPAANGFSGAGDVTAEVVYVNYGLIEDYARLDSLGVRVRGKIAIARYGRSFRGIKAREAERNGAAALIIYSDPRDDGYQVGEVYPEGPMRPADAIQRGSVLNGDGDPSTPGWPSVEGARRLAESEMEIPRIPVVPMAYGDAAELLRGLAGTRIPRDWQGGLPFRYHVGPGPVVARVQVQTDAATRGYKEIHDTFGVIRGSEFPDEIVVIGGHRDGWGPGAADNVSGTVSVIEAARAVMEQARAGNPPRRTVLFATWDAEEWGLFGSTEFVEQDSARLMRGAVAYLNQDVAATGLAFSGGGSPSLRAALRSVARGVPDPSGQGSVYQAWRRRELLPDSLEPAMDDPGGGSDFAGFYNHLGIPHSEWGFGGAYGVYHSQYDSFEWMRRFGDPEFRAHAAAAQVGAALMLRLANADVLPYDYAEFARTMSGYLPAMDAAIQKQGITASTARLGDAIEAMRTAAMEFATARDAALAAGAPGRETLRRTNAALMRVERALTRPEGLRTRPWFRALIYAADENNGYSNVVFPSISEAVRDRNAELTVREIADLASRFEGAAAALRDARGALGGR
ncbi:transferrin receptor-like dimerization domain-containing protein [Longimicrobium terrae]|uniref:N-acetylated-alpha-linked acidic dipeptidase n=1 Tax=Longimicrobium terrae TaxID=1639882 RepID=A0A841H6M4_9BACT|nr:N-acetylated-alpha-linked acidic dipeptidase [Longimicrobium terrae]MBB6073584.1 N-acetylated-alpha-linked acidic dipeptidase [Longimicrobium terrae]NNC29409.1 M20/M25/M40 family metallo-hydrolase [Longimicrobium terrae]